MSLSKIFDEPRLDWIAKRNLDIYENPLIPMSVWNNNPYDPIKAREKKK